MHEGVKQEGGVSEVEVFGTFRGNEWGNKGEVIPVTEVEGDAGVWAFEVKALGIKEYFVERSGCELSILGWHSCDEASHQIIINPESFQSTQ